MSEYFRFSRSATYGIIAALPLLVIYEILLVVVGWSATSQIRNAGDVWLRLLLASLEVNPAHATLAMILIMLLAIPVIWQREVSLKTHYFVVIFLESFLYSLLLGIVINILLSFIFNALSLGMTALPPGAEGEWAASSSALAMGTRPGPLQGLALSLGAGLFEEFIFRVLLLGGLLMLFKVLLANWLAAGISIVLAALLFSTAHYIGPLGDPFEIGSFMFRFIAGLLFTGLYYARGFAVTAYTHALYDIRVLLF